MKGKVLISAPVHEVLIKGLSEADYELIVEHKPERQKALQLIKDCVGIVTSNWLYVDQEMIDHAPLLKWIGRMGSGMEVIDVNYAQSKGVKCFSSPEGNSNAVGEHALGMLLNLTNKIASSYEEVKAGFWKRETNRGIELEGKTVGIIGYGHTGSAFAKKLSGFDVRILAYDKNAPEKIKPPVVSCDLSLMQQEADIISFHVPLSDDTVHYFNEEFLKKMKKPFWLINTSRGAVVDRAAVLKGLEEKKLMGAALDVLEEEPPVMNADIGKLLGNPAVLITPHIAGYSHEALYKMSKILLSKIVNEV